MEQCRNTVDWERQAAGTQWTGRRTGHRRRDGGEDFGSLASASDFASSTQFHVRAQRMQEAIQLLQAHASMQASLHIPVGFFREHQDSPSIVKWARAPPFHGHVSAGTQPGILLATLGCEGAATHIDGPTLREVIATMHIGPSVGRRICSTWLTQAPQRQPSSTARRVRSQRAQTRQAQAVLGQGRPGPSGFLMEAAAGGEDTRQEPEHLATPIPVTGGGGHRAGPSAISHRSA